MDKNEINTVCRVWSGLYYEIKIKGIDGRWAVLFNENWWKSWKIMKWDLHIYTNNMINLWFNTTWMKPFQIMKVLFLDTLILSVSWERSHQDSSCAPSLFLGVIHSVKYTILRLFLLLICNPKWTSLALLTRYNKVVLKETGHEKRRSWQFELHILLHHNLLCVVSMSCIALNVLETQIFCLGRAIYHWCPALCLHDKKIASLYHFMT